MLGHACLQRVLTSSSWRLVGGTLRLWYADYARSVWALRAKPGSARRLLLRCKCARSTSDSVGATAGYPEGLSPAQERQIDRYLDLLLERNKSFNLTAVGSKAEAVERHALDSLALLPVLELTQPQAQALRLIDVGSGAGLPGMVLAIARPGWQVTLLDSLRKRCIFMEEVVQELGLQNVSVACGRAELHGRDPAYREKFDLAVARAVADLSVLSELCLPFVAVGGRFVAAKGADPQVEIAAAQAAVELCGGEVRQTLQVASWAAGQQGWRTAVDVHKVALTPAKYPRREGKPGRQPLR